MTTRIVELRKGILKKNDELARVLRERFEEAGLFVLNLVSSPGTGKTAFLQRTLAELRARGRSVAALVGDLETDNDARRLAESGAPVRQINTHGICHLDAEMIEKHLEGIDLEELELLFIENVGNLVCPSSYDLGERVRVALLSVTEGEDKPLKYPTLFNSADVAVITKIDLAEPCSFDRVAALANLNEIRPGIRVFETSSKTGEGFDAWIGYLVAAWGGEQKEAAEAVASSEAIHEPKTIEADPSPAVVAAQAVVDPGPVRPAKKNEPAVFQSAREAKEYIVSLVAEEAIHLDESLTDVERKMLYDARDGWVPEDMNDMRQVFRRYHDEDEYEAKMIRLIRRAWLRARSGQSNYDSWLAAERLLRPGVDYLSKLLTVAEGRKVKRNPRIGVRILLVVVLVLLLAMVWIGR